MSYNDILELPYIVFVLGMADAPQIDYETKQENKKRPQTAQDEINAIALALG